MNDQQIRDLVLIMATVLRASSHKFVGRLAKDPELKSFDSGKCVAKTRLLVSIPGARRNDGSKPDGFTLELWGDQATQFVDACHKGDLVMVQGRCRTNRYQDRQGQQQVELIVAVDHWRCLRQPGQPAQAAQPARPDPQGLNPGPVRNSPPPPPLEEWEPDRIPF